MSTDEPISLNESVRVATPADSLRLVELYSLCLQEQSDQRGGAIFALSRGRQGDLENSFSATITNESTRVFVGELDEVPIGFICGQIEKLNDGRSLMVVTEMFVEPEARQLGVGELLIAEIIGAAKAAGCVGIDAFALPGNRETKNFFEMSGFKARLLVMHSEL